LFVAELATDQQPQAGSEHTTRAGDQSDTDPEDRRDHGGDEADEERDLCPVSDADQEVAADLVGSDGESVHARADGLAEGVRAGVREGLVLGMTGDGRDERRAERERADRQDDDD